MSMLLQILHGSWSNTQLVDLYENFGGIIQGISPQGITKKYVYSFDTAICSKGLLDCYLISKDNKFLEYAQKLNNWILSDTIENNGIIKTIAIISTALLIEKNTLKNANFLFSFGEMIDKNKKIDLIDLLAI